MNKNRQILVAAFATLALLPFSASAATHRFSINLTTGQAQDTSGMGSGIGTATYNDKTGSFKWNYVFTVGEESSVNSAHFHGPGATGVHTAPPIVTVPSAPTSPNTGSAVITPAQGADLIKGLWYLNVHTTGVPSGEIRGQVVKTGDNAALFASYNKKIKSLKKKLKAAKKTGNKAKAKKYAKDLKKYQRKLKALG